MNGQQTCVAVTGASACIGQALVTELRRRGAHVRAASRVPHAPDPEGRVEWMMGDVTDPAFCRVLTEGCTQVFHLASLRRNVAYHRAHAAEVVQANIAMTQTMIQALTDRRVPVVFFSTILAESADPAQVVVDGYAEGKRRCEELWQAYAERELCPLLIVRPTGVYGPGDQFHEDSTVIPALMVKARTSQTALTVWSDGSQERSFLYVDDVVSSLFLLLDAGVTGIQYVLPPERVTIRVLAETIRDIVKPGLALQFDSSKPAGQSPLMGGTLHPALKPLSWTPLREGLQKTYTWWMGSLH